MYLPPLRSIEQYEASINGEVKIAPNVVLAPGVIITAAPGSQVIIEADVAIGMGVVINATGGTVAIETGAALGAGVLIVGQAKIGHGACIGTATTIFNASIPASTVVAAGSVVGDRSRQVTVEAVEVELSASSASVEETASSKEEASPNFVKTNFTHTTSHHTKQPSTSTPSEPAISSTNNGSKPASDRTKDQRESEIEPQSSEKSDNNAPIGKIYVNQLLLSLFPHRKAQIDPGKNESF